MQETPPGPLTSGRVATNFAGQSQQVAVAPNGTTQVAVALAPNGGVMVSAGPDIVITPGTDQLLQATVSVLDGSSIIGYSWRRLAPFAFISTTTSVSVSAPYPSFSELQSSGASPFVPPVRHQVMGLRPVALERIKRSMDREYEFVVETTSGSYSDRVIVAAGDGRLQPTSGHWNVPRGVPVILGAPAQGSYAWSLTSQPEGGTAAIDRPAEQFVVFTPDATGTYTVTEGLESLTITAANWGGEAVVCNVCHAENTLDWAASRHATVFERNVNSGYPSETCLACHTVGWNQNAVNNGFDDAAASAGWTIPAPNVNNYNTLPPALKALANVRCESCHGPGVLHTLPAPNLAIYSASVCAACHGQAEGHGRFDQWQSSKHAGVELSMELGTVEARGTNAAYCGRCHGAQGFVRWIAQLLQGDNTNIKKPDGSPADLGYLESIGLSRAEIEPTSCAACHDSHAPAGAGSVRLADATILVPGGFLVGGLGKGTVCAACHNSRSALHEDGVGLSSFSGITCSSAADVMLGRNAFFMSLSAPRTPHASITDTCANCHMAAVPSPPGLGYQNAGKDHGFTARYEGCAQCHPGMNGTSLKTALEIQLQTLAAAISNAALEVLNARLEVNGFRVRPWDPATDLYSSSSSSNSNVVISSFGGNSIVAMEFLDIYGQMALHFSLESPIDIIWTGGNPTSTSEIYVQIGSIKDMTAPTPVAIFSTGGDLAKAAWNHALLSRGTPAAHNPGWAQEVITRSLARDLSASY